jgi:hypothetical protein
VIEVELILPDGERAEVSVDLAGFEEGAHAPVESG